jgi:hypothetical protein
MALAVSVASYFLMAHAGDLLLVTRLEGRRRVIGRAAGGRIAIGYVCG